MAAKFSHIYHEAGTLDSEIGESVLKKFKNSKLIEIKDYRELFNRKRQDWRLQKANPKLILAIRKSEFLYPGSSLTPDFGELNFFYNTLAMNCLYDCHYCYLQGMYPSANMVLFTNLNDYFAETERVLKEKGRMYLSISYDTDLLALEDFAPYSSRWLEFSRQKPSLVLELRTKSANFKSLEAFEPCENFVLAWTLSPEDIVRRYETRTPGLDARLKAVKKALCLGWQVRLCLDPVLLTPDWERSYSELLTKITEALDLTKLRDISIGGFRMNRDYYKRLLKLRPESEIINFNYTKSTHSSDTISYEESARNKAFSFLRTKLEQHMPAERVFII